MPNRPDSARKTGRRTLSAPPKQGLYDPWFEHDACGVGFVVDMKGRKSNQILKQAIQIEELAAQEVMNCEEAEKRVTAINCDNKAQANRMEAEKRVLELQQAQKKLITVDEARSIIGRAWAPLLARIRSVPKRCALKANPSDDALAEEVFREEIELAISEGQESYGAALV